MPRFNVQLPRTAILPDGIEISGDIAMATGGFTDTWRGLYRGKPVALKAFHTFPVQDLREAQRCASHFGGHSHSKNLCRSYGKRSSYGRGCVTNTCFSSTASTRRISSLPSYATGKTPETSFSIWTRTRRFPAPVWHRHHHPSPSPNR